MTDRDDLLVRKALEGMPFPAARGDVIEYATRSGEQDPTVLEALYALPDRRFSTEDDVVISVPDDTEDA